jgi:hypothetical protein
MQVEDKREFKLLQMVYLALGVISVIVCGLVGLFNQSLGVGMLIFPLIVIVAMCMNVVTWALVKLGADTMVDLASKKEIKKLAEEKKSSKKR